MVSMDQLLVVEGSVVDCFRNLFVNQRFFVVCIVMVALVEYVLLAIQLRMHDVKIYNMFNSVLKY